jgi:hypothetical protein
MDREMEMVLTTLWNPEARQLVNIVPDTKTSARAWREHPDDFKAMVDYMSIQYIKGDSISAVKKKMDGLLKGMTETLVARCLAIAHLAGYLKMRKKDYEQCREYMETQVLVAAKELVRMGRESYESQVQRVGSVPFIHLIEQSEWHLRVAKILDMEDLGEVQSVCKDAQLLLRVQRLTYKLPRMTLQGRTKQGKRHKLGLVVGKQLFPHIH